MLFRSVGIKVFIVGYEKECEKSFFCKTRSFGEWLTTGMSHEFQSPTNKKARLYFLSCSDPTIMTFQLLVCSIHVTLLVSHHLRVSHEFQSWDALWLYTLNQIFTLFHTQPLHNFHLNTEFLITELQANLTGNKANTWLNKFNLTSPI